MLRGFLYHDDDTGQPQGGDARPSDVLERYGRDALKLAEKLAEVQSENYTLREQRRTLKQELSEAKGKAAPDGARVLTADEAAAYDAYSALGKPEEIIGAISDRDTARAELTSLRRGEAFRAAAEAHGYRPGALAKLPSLREQSITVEDVTIDGKAAKRAYVTVDGKKTALPDYIQEHDSEFLPALAVEPQAPRGDGVGSPAGGGKRPSDAKEMRSPGITI